MPEHIPVFDPEVEEILRAVAANPNSYLLREPQRAGAIAPLDLEAGVSARTAGLTIAEKHLLGAWREQAAELLRQGFNASLAQTPDSPALVVKLDLNSNRVDSPTVKDVRRRAATLGATGRARSSPSLGTALEALRAGHSIDGELQRKLIMLSFRLLPTDASRICIAALELQRRRWHRSLDLYLSIMMRSPSTDARAYALSGIASVYIELEDENRRLEAIELCVQLAPSWALSHQKLFRYRADHGDTSGARDCMSEIRCLGPEAVSLLHQFLDWMGARARRLSRKSRVLEGKQYANFARVAGELAVDAPCELSALLARLAEIK